MLLALFVFLCPALALAQEAEKPAPVSVYSLGQQSFSLSLGLFIPLFFMDFDGAILDSTNLSLGGIGSLQWGIHLDNHWLVGAESGRHLLQEPAGKYHVHAGDHRQGGVHLSRLPF